jgi:hypothetical protein
MKMYVDPLSMKTTTAQLVLEHNENKLYWYVSTLNKSAFETDEVCKHINGFWERLPGYKQQLIFNIYEEIKDVLQDVYDTTQLITSLIPLVTKLYEEHDMSEMSTWISFHSDIILPSDMVENYVESDDDVRTREKTYVREDYKGLILLSLALRPMIPIWGEFIYKTRPDTGTGFKEFYAVKLINSTHLMESEPMVKLRTYVSHNIKADKPMYSNILNSVGTEDFPLWLLSHVLVRKLCISDLSCTSNETTLISSIFNFISQKVMGNPPSSLAEMVSSKDFNRSSSNDENNISRLEAFKIKQKIAPGDIAVIEHVLNDPFNVARAINPNVSFDLLGQFLSSSRALELHEISVCQVVMAQYVLKKVIPPRGLMHVSKQKVINAIAIAQTLIWDNYKPISAMMSAIVTGDSELQTNGIDSKVRIPPELMKRLELVFPYTKVSISKKKGKVQNNVLSSIDEISSLFSSRDWTLTIPDHMVQEVTGQPNLRRYSCPHDIKILLAELILETVTPK